jgi:hypothetical protein
MADAEGPWQTAIEKRITELLFQRKQKGKGKKNGQLPSYWIREKIEWDVKYDDSRAGITNTGEMWMHFRRRDLEPVYLCTKKEWEVHDKQRKDMDKAIAQIEAFEKSYEPGGIRAWLIGTHFKSLAKGSS